MPAKKPEPINKHIICSCCGMNWEAHGEKPTLENCIDLLRAELAKRPHLQTWNGISGTSVVKPNHFYNMTGGNYQ